MSDFIDINKIPDNLVEAAMIIGALKTQLKERPLSEISAKDRRIGELENQLKQRDDAVLILKIRSRIEELEKKFISRHAANQSRREKWRIILSDTSPHYNNNIELTQFRKTIGNIPVDLFIDTVCSLYSEMSNEAAHQIQFAVQYDEASIRLTLIQAGLTPDDSKVRVVSSILSPILLP